MADDGVTIQLKGSQDTVSALRWLKDELPKNLIRTALRSAADRMRRVIQAFAPHRSWRLVHAIAVKTASRAGFAHARVIINTAGKRGDPQNAYYWRFLEKGWHDRRGVPHQQQFVEPAVKTEANDAAQSVIDVVERAIDQAKSRARGY